TSVYNDSILWGGHYELPLTLAAGGWWNLTINGTVGGATYANFYVHTYDVSMTPTQNVVLAQHSTKILYFVSKTVNSAPMTNITSLTVT
ncbi:MAG: hypothetical protein L3J91_01840, partial [Thermoplasmata archaeon]|nr:hypothetical protein [Thermoplasmata archaeon]